MTTYSVEEYLGHLIKDFSKQSWNENVHCLIIFGSLVNIPSLTLNKDIDLCVVLNSRKEEVIDNLKEYINKHFIDPDITVYYLDELYGKLPFRDIGNGIFALEYFARGTTIYGQNIFIDLLTNVSKMEFKKSLLDKIFDYILRIRKKHILEIHYLEKIEHINKYLIRLLIDLFVYLEIETLTNLLSAKNYQIILKAKEKGLVSFDGELEIYKLDDENYEYEFLYSLYKQISENIQRFISAEK